jgi:hypothetical protein
VSAARGRSLEQARSSVAPRGDRQDCFTDYGPTDDRSLIFNRLEDFLDEEASATSGCRSGFPAPPCAECSHRVPQRSAHSRRGVGRCRGGVSPSRTQVTLARSRGLSLSSACAMRRLHVSASRRSVRPRRHYRDRRGAHNADASATAAAPPRLATHTAPTAGPGRHAASRCRVVSSIVRAASARTAGDAACVASLGAMVIAPCPFHPGAVHRKRLFHHRRIGCRTRIGVHHRPHPLMQPLEAIMQPRQLLF